MDCTCSHPKVSQTGPYRDRSADEGNDASIYRLRLAARSGETTQAQHLDRDTRAVLLGDFNAGSPDGCRAIALSRYFAGASNATLYPAISSIATGGP
jgi:hypothetical protein